jgi:hypothetical protein
LRSTPRARLYAEKTLVSINARFQGQSYFPHGFCPLGRRTYLEHGSGGSGGTEGDKNQLQDGIFSGLKRKFNQNMRKKMAKSAGEQTGLTGAMSAIRGRVRSETFQPNVSGVTSG